MVSEWKVPVQSLIDHIKTAVDVDPWAKEMAEELLKEQESVRVGKKIKAGDVVLDFYQCGHCKNAIRKPWRYCPFCGKAVSWE